MSAGEQLFDDILRDNGIAGTAASRLREDVYKRQVMSFIIKLSPIGVFCLITPVVAANGPQILGSLAFVLLVAYIG